VFKVVSVEQMREIERTADAGGLTYAMMMENAGRSVAQHVLQRIPEIAGRRVAILVGGGNNGGDGLVVGHYLAEAGAQVAAYLSKDRPADDVNLARLQGHGALIAVAGSDQRERVLRNLMGSADVVVDALLGTGFHLPLEGAAREMLATAGNVLALRDPRPFVVALDCPSGLDCDSGDAAPEALPADLTVTLAAAKAGLFAPAGARLVGDLALGDIGLPEGSTLLTKVEIDVVEKSMLRGWRPPRPRDAHKGTFGRAIVIAGSVNFPGAAALAGEAAYRVGAGLVTLAVPSAVQGMLAPQIPEATWLLLPHEMGAISEGAAAVLEPEFAKCQAILLGPGIGQDPVTADFLGRLLHGGSPGKPGMGFVHPGVTAHSSAALPPCIVDADGLKLLARLDGWPGLLPERSVLTPHPGEMAVLTGLTTDEIQRNRLTLARQTAATWRHVVVLKGAYTVVAEPNGACAILPFATPALARAGTGDVLAGAIAGLVAQGVDPWRAAVMGGFLHARAGELAAEALEGAAPVLASDVLVSLPAAMAELNAA
jgi:ADP-dependent NAD(P)H-hydrate dehydratase / NAD(P)H-hydrate epimerase